MRGSDNIQVCVTSLIYAPYIVRVSLRAPHEILIDAPSDLESTDHHLTALAVEPALFFQRYRNLVKNEYA